MAILTKDPISGKYIVKQGDDLTKISQSQGITLQELLANNPQFRAPTLTGATDTIQPGQTVNLPTSNQNFNLPDTSNQSPKYTPPPVINNPTPQPQNSSSADLYFQLKSQLLAQQKGYAGNDKALLMGKQNINQTNADVYSSDLKNANMRPNDLTSLLGNDQNLQSAGLKSITDQQSNNLANYNSQLDAYKIASDNYQSEQDRIATQNNPYTNYSAKIAVAQSQDQKKIAQSFSDAPASMRDESGYITPEVYRNAKARWIIAGYAGNDFDSIFNGVINPKKAEEYGIGFMTKVSSNADSNTNFQFGSGQ